MDQKFMSTQRRQWHEQRSKWGQLARVFPTAQVFYIGLRDGPGPNQKPEISLELLLRWQKSST